jgi:hypothetical protein
MLMIDVRNAIARILDRYTLGDVIEVTCVKIKRDKLPPLSALLRGPIRSIESQTRLECGPARWPGRLSP